MNLEAELRVNLRCLSARLEQLFARALIEADVANVQDEPTQVWKSHLKTPKENGRIKQILQQ